jgi:hypothetical protein
LADDPAAAAASASFVSEVFFIGQRFLRVGLMPAVARWERSALGQGQSTSSGCCCCCRCCCCCW